MGTAYTDTLDTAIGPKDDKVPIIAEKDSNGKFMIPMIPKSSSGKEIFSDDISVKINKRSVSDTHVFHSAVTAASDGTSTKLTLGGRDKVVLSISRASITANVITFHVTAPGDIAGYVLGVRIGNDGTKSLAATSSSLDNEVWVFEGLAGYTDFYVSIDSMTGASVTVTGVAAG